MDIDKITTYLAAYAAVLSTVVAIWNAHRDRKDRSKLFLRAGVSLLRADDVLTVCRLVLSLTNTGRRPLTVCLIGYKSRRESAPTPVIWQQHKHMEIHEGQRREVEFAPDKICPSTNLEYFYAVDATGKTYRTKRKELKQLLQRNSWPGPIDRSKDRRAS